MVLRFFRVALCLLIFHLSSGNNEAVVSSNAANAEPAMPNNYIPAKTGRDFHLSYGGDSFLLLEEVSALLEDLEGSADTTEKTSIFSSTTVEITNPPSTEPSDNNSCELTTCIIPIVVSVVVAIIILIAVVLAVTKCCKETPDCCAEKNNEESEEYEESEESEEPSSVDGETNHANNERETDSPDNSKTQPVANDPAARYEVNLIVKKKSGQQQQLTEPTMSDLIEAIVEDERRNAPVETPQEDLLRSIVATYDPTIRHEIHKAVVENVQRQTSQLIDETIYNERLNYEAVRLHSPYAPMSPKRIVHGPNVHGPRYNRSIADDRLTYVTTKTTEADF